MTGIAASLDHRNRHPGIFHPVDRKFYQRGANTTTLKIWIYSNHVDFTHAGFGV
jgi:hypothetical protein